MVPDNSHPTPESFHFQVSPQPDPALLVVRLRQFPGWHTLRDGTEVRPEVRTDGLIVVPLPARAPHQIDVVYRTTWDQWLGLGISSMVLATSLWSARRSRSGIMRPPG